MTNTEKDLQYIKDEMRRRLSGKLSMSEGYCFNIIPMPSALMNEEGLNALEREIMERMVTLKSLGVKRGDPHDLLNIETKDEWFCKY